MDNGQWTMEKADILQPVDQWTMANVNGQWTAKDKRRPQHG